MMVPLPLSIRQCCVDTFPWKLLSRPHNLDKRTTITIDDRTFVVEADDLEKICDLGRGAYGIVEKMRHRQTATVMAVKRITATVNTQEQVSVCKYTGIISIFSYRTLCHLETSFNGSGYLDAVQCMRVYCSFLRCSLPRG